MTRRRLLVHDRPTVARPDVVRLGRQNHFERAVAANSNNAEAQNNLGAARLAAGLKPAARAALERAVALRPVYPEAHFNLARLSALEDRRDEAVGEAAVAEAQTAAAGNVALSGQIRELSRELRRR